MSPRFQRGGCKGVSPFFAFQDIITSAMAVLIAIIMLLAMYMGGAESGGVMEVTSRELQTKLKVLLDEIVRLQVEMQEMRETPRDEVLDAQLLKGQIESLREELALTVAQGQARTTQVDVATKGEGMIVIQAELGKERKQIEDAKGRIARMEQDAARKQTELEQAAKVAQEKEAQLEDLRVRRNQLWLIPERSNSTKQPLLATVSANELTLQRFDQADNETLRGPAVTREFTSTVAKYSKADYYIVFYFKPTGASHFSRLTAAARNAGYEVGYDVIEEEVLIQFGTPR